MPRPNPKRAITAERNLAARIATERQVRGWTYDSLAERMTAAGCPIQPSAIFKTEKGDPPRRITVNELYALSQVFEMPLVQLLTHPTLDLPAFAWDLYERSMLQWQVYGEAQRVAAGALARAEELQAEYNELLTRHQGDGLGDSITRMIEARPDHADRLAAIRGSVGEIFNQGIERADVRSRRGKGTSRG